MKDIEQQKHWLFVCTLAAVAMTVNATQEFRYAKAHPIYIPFQVRQSAPPIKNEPVAQSQPAQTIIAPSEPQGDQIEAETVEPAPVFVASQTPELKQKQISATSDLMASAEMPMDAPTSNSIAQQHEERITPAEEKPAVVPKAKPVKVPAYHPFLRMFTGTFVNLALLPVRIILPEPNHGSQSFQQHPQIWNGGNANVNSYRNHNPANGSHSYQPGNVNKHPNNSQPPPHSHK